MASVADQQTAVEDFMAILNEHRYNCERSGRYAEAEIARKRIEELRAHEEARKREALRTRQLAESLALEEAHMLEFQSFNQLWDAKMQAFETNAQGLMDAMKERHAAELRDFQQKLISRATVPRHSKEYYNLRSIQEKLAHGKNYAGAAKIKEKADDLMAYEEEKWNNERQVEMVNKETAFKAKLAAEAEAMKKRIAQGRAEQNRSRQVELERMLQRYANMKAESDNSQKLDRLKLEKEIALAQKTTSNSAGKAAARNAAAESKTSSVSSGGSGKLKQAGRAAITGSPR